MSNDVIQFVDNDEESFENFLNTTNAFAIVSTVKPLFSQPSF
jgi:hypothetical protein